MQFENEVLQKNSTAAPTPQLILEQPYVMQIVQVNIYTVPVSLWSYHYGN